MTATFTLSASLCPRPQLALTASSPQRWHKFPRPVLWLVKLAPPPLGVPGVCAHSSLRPCIELPKLLTISQAPAAPCVSSLRTLGKQLILREHLTHEIKDICHAGSARGCSGKRELSTRIHRTRTQASGRCRGYHSSVLQARTTLQSAAKSPIKLRIHTERCQPKCTAWTSLRECTAQPTPHTCFHKLGHSG